MDYLNYVNGLLCRQPELKYNKITTQEQNGIYTVYIINLIIGMFAVMFVSLPL
jgi:hypothetical protein